MSAASSKPIGKISVQSSSSVTDIKTQIQSLKKPLSIERQSVRLEARGKSLKDTDTIESLKLRGGAKLYVKDLGPQIKWSTVFLAEYAGPLVVYLWIYSRPWIFYGTTSEPYSLVQQ